MKRPHLTWIATVLAAAASLGAAAAAAQRTAVPRTRRNPKGYLGTGIDGTGIRRAAPGTRVKHFLGGTTEGTGIRRAAPGSTVKNYLGGSTDGTGIRRKGPHKPRRPLLRKKRG